MDGQRAANDINRDYLRHIWEGDLASGLNYTKIQKCLDSPRARDEALLRNSLSTDGNLKSPLKIECHPYHTIVKILSRFVVCCSGWLSGPLQGQGVCRAKGSFSGARVQPDYQIFLPARLHCYRSIQVGCVCSSHNLKIFFNKNCPPSSIPPILSKIIDS